MGDRRGMIHKSLRLTAFNMVWGKTASNLKLETVMNERSSEEIV